MRRIVIAGAALTGALLAGAAEDARAQDCASGTFAAAFAGEVVLPQNWNCAEREAFWFTDQGSQILPYVWFLHLEQADTPRPSAIRPTWTATATCRKSRAP